MTFFFVFLYYYYYYYIYNIIHHDNRLFVTLFNPFMPNMYIFKWQSFLHHTSGRDAHGHRRQIGS